MGAAFLITLRDGVEAALVVAIVMAYVRQLGRSDRSGWVLAGALAGGAVAAAVGGVVYLAVGELEGSAEELTEGFTALVAVGVLTWMIFWMRSQAQTIGGELRSRVDQAMASGAVIGLASITFIGVLREGIEMSLFLLTVVFDNGAKNTAIGAFAGLGAASLFGYSIYRGGQFINLRVFFQITAGLIIFFAAGLAGRGLFELQEAGVFNSAHDPLWDVTGNPVLGHGQFGAFMKSLFGWSARPSTEQVAIWLLYVAAAGWVFYVGRLPRALSALFETWSSSVRSWLSIGRSGSGEVESTIVEDG